ncbi:MAG: hypothetical protein SFY69_03635 [Planctomycetota bacterium]|nr:hypothetical protein [Planctomycetota bacterium]
MSTWIDRLLGLERLSSADAGVEFSLVTPVPAWGWLLITLAAFAYAAWSYGRLVGPRGVRMALAGLRGVLIVLLVLLFCRPQLVRARERVERDWVVVMLDRSASMTVADVERAGRRVAREAQMRESLDAARPVLERIAERRGVLYLGFDAGAYDLAGAPGEIPEPAGTRTLLGQSLEQALRRVASRPVAGVVLVSDGRSADAVSRGTLRQLEARGTPVFVLPLGSAQDLADLAVAGVEAPGAAFAGDFVPVRVRIDRRGGEGAPVRGVVELIDADTNLTLDERSFDSSDPSLEVTVTTRPTRAGPLRALVRLRAQTPDLTQDNNSAVVQVQVVEQPIRVAYFDGYPRWEYRYVKNLLVREASIRSSALLLASDRRYIQEGTDPLPAVPRTKDEWNTIDVVVIGDIRPALFSEDQLRQIRALVAERGAGLLWIGGPSATPDAWRGTPLADLLPVTLSTNPEEGVQSWPGPVVLRPAPGAERYGVLRLSDARDRAWPAELSDPDLGWTRLYYAQRFAPQNLKPTAEVLATAHAASDPSGTGTPIIMTMRYGAGRIAYVGTDETWRYRYARGETLSERIWIPLVRLLARESLGRSGRPAILAASPERVGRGDVVRVSIRLLDQALIERRPPSVTVRITPEREGERPFEIVLRPEGGGDDDLPGVFGATWVPPDAGVYTLQPADAMFAGLDITAKVDVVNPDDELRHPQADHALLAALAEQSGGVVLDPARPEALETLLPNREVRVQGVPDIETLWDKPFVWVLFMVLVAAEWMTRRLIKLS